MQRGKVERPLTRKDIQNLLGEQSKVILSAVDSKLAVLEIRLVAEMEKKILASEERINRKLDKLTTTLDKFLKRLTDLEDEYQLIKLDLNRIKKVLHEKLGVDLL